MQKQLLGKTGINMSRITYGGIVSKEDSQADSDRFVKYAIEHGVNYFDVAPTYGNAQERLGNSLRPYRKDVYLACKTGVRTADGAAEELAMSQKLLHTDYFDVYQLHGLKDVEEVETVFAKGGAMEVLLKAKEDGIARHLGITCHSEEAVLRALELYDFETVLFPLNWGIHLKKGFGDKVLAAQKEKGLGLLGMKAFIHRAWLNEDERKNSRFPKSWCMPITDDDAFTLAALKYAFSLGIDTLVPPGNFENFSFAVEHVEECLANPLNDADMALLRSHLPDIEGHEFF
jgi:aryl-alcohol dehydrogenase-like predicted oxidoreductase